MNGQSNVVYVVDDEERMRKALTRLLRPHGFEVRAFASAREFLAVDDFKTNACLLLDVSMPDFDGFALQRHLASARHLLPVIFLTGNGDIPMSVRAMKAGASDFLTKPVQAALARERPASSPARQQMSQP
jgi:FixJ family two-component response regulator